MVQHIDVCHVVDRLHLRVGKGAVEDSEAAKCPPARRHVAGDARPDDNAPNRRAVSIWRASSGAYEKMPRPC